MYVLYQDSPRELELSPVAVCSFSPSPGSLLTNNRSIHYSKFNKNNLVVVNVYYIRTLWLLVI